MIALVIAAALSVALVLCMLRLFMGPTLHDRMLAMNAVLSKAMLIAAALAVAIGQAAWVDAALAMALSAFVLNAATLKFFRARSFQPPLAREEA